MYLSDAQRSVIIRVVNVFETGIPEGKYGSVSVYPDGPRKVEQITYGRSQTTEYGNLPALLENYIASGGQFGSAIAPYLPLLGTGKLVNDTNFKSLLQQAGKDPVMIRVQDSFFDEKYFHPAMNWADKNGFTAALSMLVIYDSFIHSGRIPDFLRARFPEVPPAKGGPEKSWIKAYVLTRQDWLKHHDNLILHKTVYRTGCFLDQIGKNNWDLAQTPVMANDVSVNPI